MKPYIVIGLLILLLAIVSPIGAQTFSNLTGFQVERIKPNSLTLVGLNTSVTSNGSTAKTIYKIFGENATNAYVKKSNDPSKADNIWVIQNDGTWLQIYYAPGGEVFPPVTEGWRAVGYGDTDMAGTLITGGFLYESKRDEEWGLAMAGFVNKNKTNIITRTKWTVLNRGTPIPMSLTGLNLSSSLGLLKGNEREADILWIQEDGLWSGYYYALKQNFPPLTEGWKKIGSGNKDFSYHIVNTSGILLQAPKWAATNNMLSSKRLITLWPPAGFQTIRKVTDPDAPPKAQVDYTLSYGIGQLASSLYFAVLWRGKQGISYTTEYYDTSTGWTFLSEREGDGVNLNFDYTIVDYLPWGVTRVTSEWVNW